MPTVQAELCMLTFPPVPFTTLQPIVIQWRSQGGARGGICPPVTK